MYVWTECRWGGRSVGVHGGPHARGPAPRRCPRPRALAREGGGTSVRPTVDSYGPPPSPAFRSNIHGPTSQSHGPLCVIDRIKIAGVHGAHCPPCSWIYPCARAPRARAWGGMSVGNPTDPPLSLGSVMGPPLARRPWNRAVRGCGRRHGTVLRASCQRWAHGPPTYPRHFFALLVCQESVEFFQNS